MLANTADAGGTEYNTVDAVLWFLHAVDRHVAVTGDLDLGAKLADDLQGIVDHHVLSPGDSRYAGHHRGGPAERDRAYHQGTVWPWLIGPYVEAAVRTGVDVPGALDVLAAHLDEWGLGSVSETAEGEPPHGATGCPFQGLVGRRAASCTSPARRPNAGAAA